MSASKKIPPDSFQKLSYIIESRWIAQRKRNCRLNYNSTPIQVNNSQ